MIRVGSKTYPKSFKIKCLKRERDLQRWKESNHIQWPFAKMDAYWQHNGDTASCAFLKLNASGELCSDQANVGRYQKLGKVVGIFQIIMGKLIKCCIQFGLARQTNKQISKDLQGIFEISLKQCLVRPKHPPKKKSFECEPLSTLFSLMRFVKNGIEWHRCVCLIGFFPHVTRSKLPNF